MYKFKKKPLEIEAVQFIDNADSLMELSNFIKGQDVDIKRHKDFGSYLIIETLEGDMKADEYDYIIKGVNGEYYPCKPDIFEKSYDRVSKDITFGEAIEALKNGKKVCRKGWNGKGMYLQLVNRDWYSVLSEKIDAIKEGMDWNLLPWIGMKTADNCFVPWLASQTDVLSNDWRVL